MRGDTPARIANVIDDTGIGAAGVEREPNENQIALIAIADHLDPATPPIVQLPRGTYGAQMTKSTPEELRRRASRLCEFGLARRR